MASPLRVLILCTGNSARSQMAEGLLRHEAAGTMEVFSAGTHPSFVRPQAIAAMADLGIDISGHTSDGTDKYIGQEFDYVITVCDNAAEACPTFPGPTQRIHWSFEDPAAATGTEEEVLNEFRRIRDQIHGKLKGFVAERRAATA